VAPWAWLWPAFSARDQLPPVSSKRVLAAVPTCPLRAEPRPSDDAWQAALPGGAETVVSRRVDVERPAVEKAAQGEAKRAVAAAVVAPLAGLGLRRRVSAAARQVAGPRAERRDPKGSQRRVEAGGRSAERRRHAWEEVPQVDLAGESVRAAGLSVQPTLCPVAEDNHRIVPGPRRPGRS
jgi:hypothetical protein